MKYIFLAILILFSAACGEPEKEAAGTNNAIVCTALSAEDCKANSDCYPIQAQPYDAENKCYNEKTVVSCIDKKDFTFACNNAVTGYFRNSETCWYQAAQCAPESWYGMDNSACDASKSVVACK